MAMTDDETLRERVNKYLAEWEKFSPISLDDAVVSLVKAISDERLKGMAEHISRDEANELQDVLRTLTNSGTALLTSARALVQTLEMLGGANNELQIRNGQLVTMREQAETDLTRARAAIRAFLNAWDTEGMVVEEEELDGLRAVVAEKET